MQLINANIMLLVWILWCLRYLLAFLNLKFVVISHSQEIFTFVPDFVIIILYSFSQRRPQKFCKLQPPQNLDPPLRYCIREQEKAALQH